MYSGVWEKHSDGNGSFTNKVSWLPCDSDVSQHKGPSSVCPHWVSGSGEQNVDPSNVKARNFQNSGRKKQDTVRKAQKERAWPMSHMVFSTKKGLDSTAPPLTNP